MADINLIHDPQFKLQLYRTGSITAGDTHMYLCGYKGASTLGPIACTNTHFFPIAYVGIDTFIDL